MKTKAELNALADQQIQAEKERTYVEWLKEIKIDLLNAETRVAIIRKEIEERTIEDIYKNYGINKGRRS